MKLTLKTDEVAFEDHSYGRGVYVYKSGGIAVRIEDPNSPFPVPGTVVITYNTGDQLTFVPDGDEHRLVRIISHDGITWNEKRGLCTK